MDEAGIEARGLASIAPEVQRIRGPDGQIAAGRGDRAPASDRCAQSFRVRQRAGFQGLERGGGAARSGRTWVAGSRLLPEGRSEERGAPAKIPGARAAHVRAGGRSRRTRRRSMARNGDADRDRTGQGLAGPGFTARSGEDLSSDEARRHRDAGAVFPVGEVFHGRGRAGFPIHRSGVAGFLQGGRSSRSRRHRSRTGRSICAGTCCMRRRRCCPLRS